MADLSKEQLLNITLDNYRKSLPSPDVDVKSIEIKPIVYEDIKKLQSKDQVQAQIEEQISKIKFPLETTALTSVVPLGLAYYSYHNNFSFKKGLSVVVIGSVVAWYGLIVYGFNKK